jgi:hypothetical protein
MALCCFSRTKPNPDLVEWITPMFHLDFIYTFRRCVDTVIAEKERYMITSNRCRAVITELARGLFAFSTDALTLANCDTTGFFLAYLKMTDQWPNLAEIPVGGNIEPIWQYFKEQFTLALHELDELHDVIHPDDCPVMKGILQTLFDHDTISDHSDPIW